MKIWVAIILCLLSIETLAQTWVPTSIADMPKAVSNNAVSRGSTTIGNFMYSFGGIDSSKASTGIVQSSFRYDITNDVWSSLPDLPDTLGKIASAASTVKGKIYIIGGYHVLGGGAEVSSSRVHIFDPVTNVFLTDGMPVPVPIDDQAQCVWRDSLIYVISGWSNTGNVNDVQIYNPTSNTWQVGTAVPNNNDHKVFGAQATIKGDTIYYYGGANMLSNFPSQATLRIGIIDAVNPTSINWLTEKTYVGHPLYRMIGITNPDGNITFLGGSAISYNYNGLAYTNNQGVQPANEQVVFNPNTEVFSSILSNNYPMDLRGHADISSTVKYICGGMEQNQTVSKKAYKLTFTQGLWESNFQKKYGLQVFPNPAKESLSIDLDNVDADLTFEILNSFGQKVTYGRLEKSTQKIDLRNMNPGNYFLLFKNAEQNAVHQFTIK